MKRILTVLFVFSYVLGAIACQSPTDYRDDIPTSTLFSSAVSALPPNSDYVFADDFYLDAYFKTPDFVTEQSILYAEDGSNLNEIGIFHVSDGEAKAMETLIRGYLSETLAQNQAFYDSYIPQETNKLRHAEVRSYGNYVTYAILDENDKKIFFSAIEDALRKI